MIPGTLASLNVAQASACDSFLDLLGPENHRLKPVPLSCVILEPFDFAQDRLREESRTAKKLKAKTAMKPRKRPGPEPEVLKIEGNWDTMRKLISN